MTSEESEECIFSQSTLLLWSRIETKEKKTMTNITISGRITKKWNGPKKNMPPINIIAMDDSSEARVYFKTAFWATRDFDVVNVLNEGDEIEFTGHAKKITPYNDGHTMEIALAKLVSYTKTERKTYEMDNEDVFSNNDAAEASLPRKGEKHG